MHTIILLPQIGVHIKGIGQINFGDTRKKIIEVLGEYKSINREGDLRVEYCNYGFFADFKKADDTFEAVEFWNEGKENVSEVYIYDQEVLQSNAQDILAVIKEKNNGEDAIDGWFYHTDIIYSGGNPKIFLAIIEQAKAEGTYEASKEYLQQDLENTKYFTTFGIGYNGYCKDGLEYLKSLGL